MSKFFYADGYFPPSAYYGGCALYTYKPNLENPFNGRTYAGYQHPSTEIHADLADLNIYTSYIDNLTLGQAAKIYWRGRCTVRVNVPSDETYGLHGIPLHRMPSGARTKWGANSPEKRICKNWGWELLNPAYEADPLIPSGTLGQPLNPPPEDDYEKWTQFAAKCEDVSIWVNVFSYKQDDSVKYGVTLSGIVNMMAALWEWRPFVSENPSEGEWVFIPGGIEHKMGFCPSGTLEGSPHEDITIETPWGNFTTTTSNNVLFPEGFNYKIIVEEDETFP